jgi:methionyl-tRNA synthetase
MATRPTRTLVTAALPYANGPLHIGHLAGAYLPADIYVRHLRMAGQPVLFVCGSDEHGVAITIRARKEGISPQELIDKYHHLNRQAFADFGIAFDIYSRTSTPQHRETAQAFFRRWEETGQLVEQVSEQFYDPQEQMFLPDRYLLGTCPTCANPNAYGDQCEKCGRSLSPTELIEPRSALSGAVPERRNTSHWFLPLDVWNDRLREYVVHQHADWKPNVFGQCKSWLDEGLRPRAITRDLDWGIPVPLTDDRARGKVLYVWFDAPIGYISATQEWAAQQGTPDAWKPWWLKPEAGGDGHTRILHFIGKDNIVFHCLIFPVILMGHGDYLWADNVPANEFLNLEGQKISTSRNWAIWMHEFAAEHPDQIDVMRYVIASNFPETSDAEFTWKDYLDRNNNELVAVLGNFVNRVLTLVWKYYNGTVPTAIPQPEDHLVLLDIKTQTEALHSHTEAFRFRAALQSAMELARAGNKYLQEAEPWKRIGTDPDRVAQVLYTCTQLVAALGAVFRPFLPGTSDRIFRLLNLPAIVTWTDLLAPERLGKYVPAGHLLAQPELLFQKLDAAFTEAQLAKLEASRAENAPAATPGATSEGTATPEAKLNIQYEDFAKLDLRIATIVAAERVPKADKLLKLTLDDGTGTPRTVVSGIAEHYAPEAIVGQQVVIVANLEPRKLRGIESQGMVLMAEAEGQLLFVATRHPSPPGSEVR